MPFQAQDTNSRSSCQVMTMTQLRAELGVSRNWVMARLGQLAMGVDWFTVQAGNRIAKGGSRRGGADYRFRVSALDKLRQSALCADELDPVQGTTIREITDIIRRRSNANLEAR